MGRALDYVAATYGALVNELEGDTVTGAVAVPVTANQPDCFGTVLINTGANDVWIGLSANVSANSGIRLPALGGQVSMNVLEDLTLPTRQWFAVSPAGASNVHSVQVIGYSNLDQ